MKRQGARGKARWGLIGFGVGGLVLGASALVLALIAVGILVVPCLVWVAWNVLDFGAAIGAPELGFWGIVLLTLFLTTGFGGRLVIALVVWLVDPAWLSGAMTLHWPQPSFRTFLALVLLLAVAQIPAHTHGERGTAERRSPVEADEGREPGFPRRASPV